MKKGLLTAYLSFLVLIGFSQKQINDANAQERKIEAFHELRVSDGIKVFFTQDDEYTVVVSANTTAYRDKIRTELSGGVLRIYVDRNMLNWKKHNNQGLRAYVSAKSIDNLRVEAGASLVIEGSLTGSGLKLDCSSGAMVEGKLQMEEVSVSQSSGSIVSLEGSVAKKADISGSSGSIFKGYELVVGNCTAHCSSGAGIQITANGELKVSANSGGYIRYRGEGSIREVKTSSGGSVSKKS